MLETSHVIISFLSSLLLSMVFVITRAFQSRKLFRVNQTTLRAVLNQKTCHPSAQAIQIQARFVCVYNSSRLPFIAVSNRYSRCLDHCFRSLFTWIYFNLLQNTEDIFICIERFSLLSFLVFSSAAFLGIHEWPSRAI